jgi:choline dehydrogenase-like flavoprotein
VIDVFALGEQLPSEASRVCLAGGAARARFTLTLTACDRMVLSGQRAILSSMASAIASQFKTMSAVPWTTAPHHTPSTALALALGRPGAVVPYTLGLGTMHHDTSTLPLGVGLLDDTGRALHAGPTYITGSAVFPRAGAANPALTVLALAKYAARAVARGI